MSRFLRWLAPSVLAAVSCNNSAATSTTFAPATAVAVSPSDFLGSVACLDAPGAMQSYVATLYSVAGSSATEYVRGPAIVSSDPTPCFRAVLFQNVALNEQYIAEVDGYELPPNALAPVVRQGRALVRVLPDGSHAGPVSPRWTTLCGLPLSAAQSAPRNPISRDAGVIDASIDAEARDASADAAPAPPVSATVFAAPLVDASGPIDASCVLPYLNRPLPDGATPELNGPACVETQLTAYLRSCAPLTDLGVASSMTGAVGDAGRKSSNSDAGDAGRKSSSSDAGDAGRKSSNSDAAVSCTADDAGVIADASCGSLVTP